MTSCCKAGERQNKKTGIDKIHRKIFYSKTKRWNELFQTLVAIVQFPAERILPFRASVERIREPSNGNFLSLIELLGKFDPIMGEHLQRVTNAEIHNHYLGKRIQFFFISILILLTCRKATEALIHRVSDYPNLLPEMPKYCCPLVIKQRYDCNLELLAKTSMQRKVP